MCKSGNFIFVSGGSINPDRLPTGVVSVHLIYLDQMNIMNYINWYMYSSLYNRDVCEILFCFDSYKCFNGSVVSFTRIIFCVWGGGVVWINTL